VSSSSVVKQDIADLGALADRVLALRPVAFRCKNHAALDPDTPLQFGLIAEEVAKCFPSSSCSTRRASPREPAQQPAPGRAQRQQTVNQRQQAELRLLHARLASVEKKAREPR
jgi:hypothetical protein